MAASTDATISFPGSPAISRAASPTLSDAIESSTETTETSGFETLTRRLSDKDKLSVTGRIANVDLTDYEDVKRSLQEGMQQTGSKEINPLFSLKEFDDLALKALSEQEISLEQFTTAILIKQATANPKIKEVQAIALFNEDGTINPKIEDLAITLMVPELPRLDSPKLWDFSKKFEDFVEKMRDKPKSEQVFLKMIDTDHPEDKWNSLMRGEGTIDKLNVVDQVKRSMNIFGSLPKSYNSEEEGDNGYKVVPSFSMMQTFLDETAPEASGVIMVPQIGIITDKNICEDIPKNERVFSIGIDGFELPKEADGFSATPEEFSYHDFYHSFLFNGIPLKHKQAIFELAQEIQAIPVDKEHEFFPYIKEQLFNAVIDLEAPGYVANRDKLKNEGVHPEKDRGVLIWDHILGCVAFNLAAKERILSKKEGKSLACYEFLGFKRDEMKAFITKLAQQVKPRLERWSTKYGITHSSLQEANKHELRHTIELQNEGIDTAYLVKVTLDAFDQAYTEVAEAAKAKQDALLEKAEATA